MKRTHKLSVILFGALLLNLLFTGTASAHPADIDISTLSATEVSFLYLKLGFTHILPYGLDHILFILGLYFLNPSLKQVIWQATAFTVAHSVTLALAMAGIVNPIGSIVEPVIALSIVFIAVENFFSSNLNPFRIVLVFIFGLIHGLGFAGVLGELGMPDDAFASSLLMFNIGVELGQLAVILIAYIMVGKWFGQKSWYRQRIVYPVSACIACVGLYWAIERTI
jgi:hypothetical protein